MYILLANTNLVRNRNASVAFVALFHYATYQESVQTLTRKCVFECINYEIELSLWSSAIHQTTSNIYTYILDIKAIFLALGTLRVWDNTGRGQSVSALFESWFGSNRCAEIVQIGLRKQDWAPRFVSQLYYDKNELRWGLHTHLFWFIDRTYGQRE